MTIDNIKLRSLSMLGNAGVTSYAINELCNNNTIVITADQCSAFGLSRFKNQHPEQFFNIGIAEQNMITVASGLSKEGFDVFCFAQAPFITSRCADQIRVCLGYMQLPVKLIGLGAGLQQSEFGATHECINDIALIRSIPNIVILSPADGLEAFNCIKQCINSNNPIYIRLTGDKNMPIIYKNNYDFNIGEAITIKDGIDIAIIATGSMVSKAIKIGEKLEYDNISAKIINMHTIKPIDTKIINECLKTKLIITIEEHNIYGGLGGAIAEYISQFTNHPPLKIFGIKDQYYKAQNYEKMLKLVGLDESYLTKEIKNVYKEIQ